ncbi:hypothetical protein M0805_005592 [Coniferiporia weirii]|nr:hypothetical protein M0805_005592 [Coniferiporia weirii]
MLPSQSVSMDFITDLPLSNHYDSIMVVVDHDSSKGIVLILLRSKDWGAVRVADASYAESVGRDDEVGDEDSNDEVLGEPHTAGVSVLGRVTTESMQDSWEGPFPITQVLSPLNYHLKLPPAWKIHPVFHASLLSAYTETDIHGPPFTQPPPDQIEGHQEFEIEAIVSHKGNGSRRRFLVKWTGYPSSKNQWLLETELSHATKILQTYKKLKNL